MLPRSRKGTQKRRKVGCEGAYRQVAVTGCLVRRKDRGDYGGGGEVGGGWKKRKVEEIRYARQATSEE